MQLLLLPPFFLPPPSPAPLLFRVSPLLEGVEMLCSAVFVSVVRQMKALCVRSSVARKGEGRSLYLTSFSHMLHWLRDTLEK